MAEQAGATTPLRLEAGAPNDPLFIGVGEHQSPRFPDRAFIGAQTEVAIAALHARTILCLQTERWGSADLAAMVTMLTANGIPQEWERASGITFNAVGGMITQRYMYESKSTPEEMAAVCVGLREWAKLNPNAM